MRGGWRTVGKGGEVGGGRLTNSYSSKSWISEAGMKVWNPCRKAFIWGWMARVILNSVTSWTYSAWETTHTETKVLKEYWGTRQRAHTYLFFLPLLRLLSTLWDSDTCRNTAVLHSLTRTSTQCSRRDFSHSLEANYRWEELRLVI